MPSNKPTAGKFRQRATIEENRPTAAERGRPVPNWQPIGGRWAELMPQGGSEYLAAKQMHPEAKHLVRMYAAAGLTTEHRIRLTIPRTRKRLTLNIISVADFEGSGLFMDLICNEAESN